MLEPGHSSPTELHAKDFIEKTKEGWSEFVAGATVPPGQVRESTRRAWMRSREAGCDPQSLKARVLSLQETRELLQKEKDLIEAAHPYLVALSRAAGEERHAAMLGDHEGVVLEIVGDEKTMRDPNFPGPGSLLSEAVAGANGIGTALAEKSYAELVGPEHYIEGFHVFTCQGQPILGLKNEIVGVLSTSVRRTEAAQRIHEILICATHGIESELRRLRLENSVRELIRSSISNSDTVTSLTRLREDLLQFQTASWLHLQTAAWLVSENEKSSALELVELSNRLSADFKKQSDLWQSLAEETYRAPEPVNLSERLQELLELMRTEAATRKLRLKLSWPGEMPILILDWGDLSRQLFHHLLKMMSMANEGSEIEIKVAFAERKVQLHLQVLLGVQAKITADSSFEVPAELERMSGERNT